jgi:hypothetical protein
MSAHISVPGNEEVQEPALHRDERWRLVQRIVGSERFQRATQLRNILFYISKSAILHPDEILSEYTIAREVLGRREDFDPAADNIVRAQFTHLRRKLESYFSEEGRAEPIVLSIPKGSYIPVFTPVPVAIPLPDLPAELTDPVAQLDAPEHSAEAPILSDRSAVQRPSWRRFAWPAVAGVAIAACAVLSAVLLWTPRPSIAREEKPAFKNAFLGFLARSEGNVMVVLPDTSEMMIQLITGANITAVDYSAADYPQKQIATVKDPAVRNVLSQLAYRRNTTAIEAKIAFDMVDALNRAGAHGAVRYARDMHVRDFNEGNTILIGSQRSDPWFSLFTAKTNFQFVTDPVTNGYYFHNVNPLPGEQTRYSVPDSHEKTREGYADIVLMQNSTQSGFVLLIVGTDVEAAEAAANFLLRGHLPAQIDALLARKDLTYFEIFLSGKHIVGESDDSLQVVTIRPR